MTYADPDNCACTFHQLCDAHLLLDRAISAVEDARAEEGMS